MAVFLVVASPVTFEGTVFLFLERYISSPIRCSSETAEADLAISRGVVDTARFPTICLDSRLSIKIINPESTPIIPAIHQAQLATKRYWFPHAKDIIFSSA
jgi:hypothetical protein